MCFSHFNSQSSLVPIPVSSDETMGNNGREEMHLEIQGAAFKRYYEEK
jgi:hypothetical protein